MIWAKNMGGMGSGSYTRWNKAPEIESFRRIDIRYMNQQGLLGAEKRGKLSWSARGKPCGDVRYQCQDDCLVLEYRYCAAGGDWQDVKQRIMLTSTPCHYGGERKWFACPGCSRRVAILCGWSKLFLCRHCYGLTYRSSAEGKRDRLYTQKHKLGEAIFQDYKNGRGLIKKKGMHYRIFQKKLTKYRQVEGQLEQSLEDVLDRMLSR